MNSSLKLSLLLLAALAYSHAFADNQCNQCDSNVILISQANVGRGYVISEPGSYCLIENIVFTPPAATLAEDNRSNISGPSAITIKANNVNLNLNGYTLSQGNTVAGVNGIAITGVSEVVVANGNVESFTRTGVTANDCSVISLQGLTVAHCGSGTSAISVGGIFVTNLTDSTVTNCVCDHSIPFGISGAALQNVIFTGNTTSNTTSTAVNVIFGAGVGEIASGIFLGDTFAFNPDFTLNFPSTGVIVRDCHVSSVHGQALVFGLNVSAFVPPLTGLASALVEDCTVDHLFTDAGAPVTAEVVGIDGVNVLNLVIRGCTVTNLANTTGGEIDGIVMSSSNSFIENCIVAGLSGSSVTANATINGFIIESALSLLGADYTNVTFNNCSASNLVNAGTTGAYGFRLFGPGSGSTPPFVPGVGLIVENCSAENITGTGNTGFGFFFNAQTNLTARNNIAVGNNVGMQFQDLTGYVASANNLVENNTLIGNVAFGINDLTTANNAYIANVARTNGTNYSGLPANTPIRTWAIGSAPAVSPAGNLDNISVTP